MEELKTIGQLYFEVIKKYGLPVRNHTVTKRKIAELSAEIPANHARHYLQALLARDLEHEPGEYKPVLHESMDIYYKRIKIEQFFRANRPAVTGRVQEQIAEAEALRRNQFED